MTNLESLLQASSSFAGRIEASTDLSEIKNAAHQFQGELKRIRKRLKAEAKAQAKTV